MADRSPELQDIKITPEMIEAGVDAYCYEWRGQREPPDEEDVAIAVYRAMAGVARCGPSKH